MQADSYRMQGADDDQGGPQPPPGKPADPSAPQGDQGQGNDKQGDNKN